MKVPTRSALLLMLALSAQLAVWSCGDQAPTRKAPDKPISSRIVTTDAGDLVLVQEAWFDAPRSALWRAHTTAEGWMAWAAPQAQVDLRIGGTIRTRYDTTGKIGDAGTNTLHILNYVPLELLTLRAEPNPSWPESLQKDAERLCNVIVFDEVDSQRTRMVSYGIGYRNNEEHKKLLEFFKKANEGLLAVLKEQVEKTSSDRLK